MENYKLVSDRIRFGLQNNFSRDGIENKCKKKKDWKQSENLEGYYLNPGKRWTIVLISRVKMCGTQERGQR